MASLGGLAVIFASDDPDRVYVGLSMLVSTAVEGDPACGLLTRDVTIDADMRAAIQDTDVKLYACESSEFERSSIPRFLKATQDARLVVV